MAVHPQRAGEDVYPRRPGEVEHSEQVELLGHVLGAADLVDGDVEGEEFAEARRLDLDQLLGFVGVIEGQHVEADAIANGLGHPLNLQGQVVAVHRAEPVAPGRRRTPRPASPGGGPSRPAPRSVKTLPAVRIYPVGDFFPNAIGGKHSPVPGLQG